MVTLQDIFVLTASASARTVVLGRFRATGLRPMFSEQLKASGIQLPESIFEHVCEV
jgi:pilus assembly protein CpaF